MTPAPEKDNPLIRLTAVTSRRPLPLALAGLVLADLFAALNQREGPMRIEGRCEDGE